MEKPKSPWTPPDTEDFKALDRARELLQDIRAQILEFSKKNDITYEPEVMDDRILIMVQDGDANVLRARMANIVGRMNEKLKTEPSPLQLTYEEVDGIQRIRVLHD